MPGTAAGCPVSRRPLDGRPIRPAALRGHVARCARRHPLWTSIAHGRSGRLRCCSARTWISSAPSSRQAGLLLAGPDPVGINGLVPGFGDQREIELLVDAGLRSGPGNSHRNVERSDLPRAPGSHRVDCPGQERGPRRDARVIPAAPHRRHRKRRDRVQGRGRLRYRQAAGIGEGSLRRVLGSE